MKSIIYIIATLLLLATVMAEPLAESKSETSLSLTNQSCERWEDNINNTCILKPGLESDGCVKNYDRLEDNKCHFVGPCIDGSKPNENGECTLNNNASVKCMKGYILKDLNQTIELEQGVRVQNITCVPTATTYLKQHWEIISILLIIVVTSLYYAIRAIQKIGKKEEKTEKEDQN